MPARGKLSVLLMEHCSENLNWVEEHLSCLNIDLFWSSSGVEALSLARENDFVMALLGVNNPEDGVETAQLILSHPLTQHLPIIFVSNGPMEVSLCLKGIGTGIVDYLAKPIEPLILYNKLHLFLELYHQRRAARQHITALRETHQQLRKSKARYRRLLESVTSYVYSVTVSDGVPVATLHGQGCESVTGFSPEEYAADPELWIRMIPGEDRPSALDAAERILYSPAPLEIEHRIHHKDGQIHWVRNTLVPHFNLEGSLISYDGIISDVTERKGLEEQLRQAQKMEAIGQMAGGIAHDFNNILTVILGYGCAVQDGFSMDDPQRENIDQVLAAAERAANLTRSLLVFSRKQVMTPQLAGLNDIVKNIEKLIGRIIGEDIRLKTVYSPACPKVYADAGQIEQVLMNLTANARDAMPKGGTLILETHLFELDDGFVQAYGYGEPGPYALLTVSDTGEGMDEEARKRIFEPFFTTKEVGQGTGLGLSIAYGIIRQHKGYVTVYSEPGVGTIFKIFIPLASGAENAKPCKSAVTPAGGTETILLADDDADIRRVAASNLKGLGYAVILAEDGEDAVEMFRGHKNVIDLVVLDMLMPRKNGWEVCEEIMSIRPDIRILFMSGYSRDMLCSKGLDQSGSEVLMKPFGPLDLARKVRKLLDTQVYCLQE